jgi:ABC-type multidrug transport system ATPase subunit/ABC-type multidrug transport system permease subunit
VDTINLRMTLLDQNKGIERGREVSERDDIEARLASLSSHGTGTSQYITRLPVFLGQHGDKLPEDERAILWWRDVYFEVPLKIGKKVSKTDIESASPTKKVLLNNVGGVVRPGEVLFVMGPSGSGKTTLLSALSDRIEHQVGLQTPVYVNDIPREQTNWRQIHAFVEQEDALYGSLTVRESLRYAATLQLGPSVSKSELEDRVDQMLRTLGLEDAQNTLVGSPFFRGISGGQKRRLSIGVEILRLPSILFLDEPTSGLDSAAAFHLMVSIRNLAAMGVTIVATIHQPAARVLALSDKLMLLSRGRTVYFGPTSHAVKYFEKIGYPLPNLENPADFFLDCINSDFASEEQVEKISNAWTQSEEKKVLDAELEKLRATTQTEQQSQSIEVKPVPRWHQVQVLTRRNALNYRRNPAAVLLRMAMYVALSIFVGLVYLRLGKNQLRDIVSVLFFVAAFLTFMSVSTVVMFIEERLVFLRERGNGLYSVDSWMIANTLVSIPAVFLISLVNSSIVYWMVGLTPTAGRFFFFIWNLFLALAVAEALMMLISILVPIAILAIALGAAVYGAYMLTCGFFATFNKIGWWVRWIGYISLHTYGFGSFMANNFGSQTGFSENVVGDTIQLNGAQVLEFYDVKFKNIWMNSGILIAMIAFYRLCSYVVLQFFVSGRK